MSEQREYTEVLCKFEFRAPLSIPFIREIMARIKVKVEAIKSITIYYEHERAQQFLKQEEAGTR